jgi:hypothetical protein
MSAPASNNRADSGDCDWSVVPMMPAIASKSMRFAAAGALAFAAAGCSTLESFIPVRAPVLTGQPVAYPSDPTTQPTVLPRDALDIDCPQLEVQDGTSSIRVGGESNASVRYQFDISETARECQPQGNQFAIKVGVAGHLLIGPAGSPGAYSANLRVVIRRESDKSAVVSKVYRVESNTGTASEGSFQIVTEPFPLPFTHRQMDQDYTILVGFDNGHGGIAIKPARRRRG